MWREQERLQSGVTSQGVRFHFVQFLEVEFDAESSMQTQYAYTFSVSFTLQPVPEKERNGIITEYYLSTEGKNIKVTNVISNQGTVTLDTDKGYVVSVRASTKMGRSPNLSTLLIESVGQSKYIQIVCPSVQAREE